MAEDARVSVPLKLVIRLLLTIALVWALNTWLSDYFFVDGGLAAYIIIGSLLTLMNIVVRPVLNILLFPFKLIVTGIALIVANGIFLWLTERVAEAMDPDIVVLQVSDGIAGWLFIAIILGIANWVMKEMLR